MNPVCRHCGRELKDVFIDLFNAPPANSYLKPEDLRRPETLYPLKVMVCSGCFLVQTVDCLAPADIFKGDYAYFSSYSASWLEHARQYAEMIIERLRLDHRSRVLEIACNDGYLLRNFPPRNIPCQGVEPSGSTAAAARALGLSVIEDFFGLQLAQSLQPADLIIANNVLAHVPDINDFVRGLKAALKPGGVITLEFPHLLNLIRFSQFDTIYHEHFSYLSLLTVTGIFNSFGLDIYDVEELETHGGSLRLYAGHENQGSPTAAVLELRAREQSAGLDDLKAYQGFDQQAMKIKAGLLDFLLAARKEGRLVAAYGAAAKGNTLLNYAGVRADLIAYVVDASPHKQGLYLPQSHIPIVSQEFFESSPPDYVLILPWNLRREISGQLDYLRGRGTRLAVAVPELKII